MNSATNTSYKDYMQRVGRENIPCYEPSLGADEIKLLTDVINTGWLSENKYTREFESRLAGICNRKHAIAFCNATSALITGMKSLGIGAGDEVILPSFAHGANPNSISATGASPIFADVNEDTLCLSIETIDAVKTPKTKAIMLVSLYGSCPDLEAISNYAKKNKLFLIHDCAPALFGTYKDKPIASFGDLSVLSFFADKTITTGEGGMLLSDNPDLISECNIYKHDGRKERGTDLIERKGYNFRITELQTAVGVAQLNKADQTVKRKLEILSCYEEKLKDIMDCKLFKFHEGAVPHRVIIFVPDAKKLIAHLSSLGIGVRTTFMPLNSMPIYNDNRSFAITEKLYSTGVCLPSAPSLTDENIDFVCNAIKKYFS